MGFWSSIGRTISNTGTEKEPAVGQPDKLGFQDFDAYMQRLRNYDPAAELANAEEIKAEEKTAVEQTHTQQKTTLR